VRRFAYASNTPFIHRTGTEWSETEKPSPKFLIPKGDQLLLRIREQDSIQEHRFARQSFTATEQFNARGHTFVKKTIDFLDDPSIHSARLLCFSPTSASQQTGIESRRLAGSCFQAAPRLRAQDSSGRLWFGYSSLLIPEAHSEAKNARTQFTSDENGSRKPILQLLQSQRVHRFTKQSDAATKLSNDSALETVKRKPFVSWTAHSSLSVDLNESCPCRNSFFHSVQNPPLKS